MVQFSLLTDVTIAFWAEGFERGELVRALYVMRRDGSGQRRLTAQRHVRLSTSAEPPT